MEQRRWQPSKSDLCITLHQPWASLLVHGIKRIEGRSWPAPLNVLSERIWIHAASKVPDASVIQAMETFYREVYAVDGITDIKFPEHYPVSVLLGSVKIVGCLKVEELVSWEDLPSGVRLEGQTDYCWLCEEPKKLAVPFQMRGWVKIYNLEKRIAADASRGLRPVLGPAPVKFQLPDSSDSHSLQPGSIQSLLFQGAGKSGKLVSSPSLDASIADARAAATQFRRNESSDSPGPTNDRRRRSENQEKSRGPESTRSAQKNNQSAASTAQIKKNNSLATHTWVRKPTHEG